MAAKGPTRPSAPVERLWQWRTQGPIARPIGQGRWTGESGPACGS